MQAIHFAVAFVILLVCSTGAIADSYLPSTSEAFLSPSGKHLVRIEAADSVEDSRFFWKYTEFNVFSYDEKLETYERVNKFDVEGHPLQLFINDAGTHIVTIDQQFGVGYGQIAAIYNFKGKRLAQWTLSDLFKVENLFDQRKLPKFRRSTSSIYWRGDAGWGPDQNSVWISAPPTKLESKADGSYAVIYGSDMDSYVIDLKKLEMRRVAPKNQKAQVQAGADQPATAPESKSEGKDKPQPESKVAPR